MNDLLNPRSLAALDPQPGDRVLDVGCGLGLLTSAFAELVGSEGVVVGVEHDSRQLERARKLLDEGGAPAPDLRTGDALDLPLSEEEWGSFDIVHCRFLLEHVERPEAVVKAMLPALRPGGRIVLEDDDHDLLRMWPDVPEFEHLWSGYIEAWDRQGHDPFVGRRLVRLLHASGAEVVKNDLLFYGGSSGGDDFSDTTRVFREVVSGASRRLLSEWVVTKKEMEEGLDAFDRWSRQPDSALWYATCWAEGRRPAKKASRGPRSKGARRGRKESGAAAPQSALLAIPQHTVETTDRSFSSLGLSSEIVESLTRVGFEHPTSIQAEVIPIALTGKDLIGLAQTGSGKTAAFCLPLAERVESGGGVRGLILCPTREIAMQTSSFLTIFGDGHGLRSVELIGGVSIEPQISKLRRGADLVVATPGRLLDHIRRGTIKVDAVKELVLDEADHMLDLGFLPQIRDVLEALPEERQTLMFSATMPAAIERLAQRFMKEAVRIDLLPQGAAEGIDHRLFLVEERNKKPCLLSLVAAEKGSVLVFLRRKVDADWACRQLEIEGHPVRRIHSGLSQSRRDAALSGFRAGEHRVLVATDVAARGIDVPRIEHIINFDPPQTVDDYIHRAGRTARGALTGTVSTIATWDAKPFLRQIEAALGEKIPRCVAEGVEPYVEGRPPKPTRRRLR